MQLLECPSCRAGLVEETEGVLRCSVEGTAYAREAGIWRLVDASGGPDAAGFLTHYREVRRYEGWGAADNDYYRALPFVDTTERHAAIWKIGATTYRLFIDKVLRSMEAAGATGRVLDLGAGNGWLSYRLARRGHEVAAVDINDDPADGLGAHVHYDPEVRFELVQASFDNLPWCDGAVDLAIYNGSFHYSRDYGVTLGEALRVLAPGGRVVILDSPFYRRHTSGTAMVREREDAFRADYGIDSRPLINEGFLTGTRLRELAHDLGVSWQVSFPYHGLRAALRPLRNRISGRREQARFPLVVGTRNE